MTERVPAAYYRLGFCQKARGIGLSGEAEAKKTNHPYAGGNNMLSGVVLVWWPGISQPSEVQYPYAVQ